MFENLINIPTKVLFGSEKINEVSGVVDRYGKKVLLIVDPFFMGTKIYQSIIKNLKASADKIVPFNDISPNPRNTVIDQAVRLCIKEKCDVVLAIGGGSAIDTAKAVAIIAVNGGKTWDYTERENEYVARPEKKKLPLIVIPTTSGTGTEVTPYAVINNVDIHFKATIINEMCFPTMAIVDPQIMVSKPPMLTALTGIDAFSHAFESYINKNSTPFSKLIALESMRLFAENIKECCNNGKNIEARANMALASTYGGLAIAHAPTTLPHAIGQPLSGLTDAPHGGSIAACIGAIIDWTLPLGQSKFAKIAELFDSSIADLPEEEKAAKLPELISGLFGEILDEKVTMSGYGLTESQIDGLADMVLQCYIMDCKCHPKMPAKQDIVNIIHKSF